MLRAVLVLALCTGLAAATQDDAAPVRKKLDESKAVFDHAEIQFRVGVVDWFDEQEEAARKAGNKKQVDQIVAERTAFRKTGEYPPATPKALVTKFDAARKAREASFQTAVRDFTKVRLDDQAKKVEDELREFRYTTTPLGRRLRDKPARLVNANSGKIVAVADGSAKDGAPIIQYDWGGSADQQWELVPTDDDCYLLKNLNSKSYLGRKDDARVCLVKAAEADMKGHHWRFTPVRGAPDRYTIQNRMNGKYLGVEGGSKGNAAHVGQFKLNGTAGSPDQHWKVEKVGD
jgi:hypothetical protein